jgi:geranylgeranyl diphosphate synthase type I
MTTLSDSERAEASLQEQWPEKIATVIAGVGQFSQNLRQEVANEHPYLRASIESYLSLLERGGKRTRGVLTIVGYELFGGDNIAAITTAAGIVEVQHAYLLVMDDIADNSALRRAGPTAHIFMRDFFTKMGVPGDTFKLGVDAAQGAALIAQHTAQTALLQLRVPAKQKNLAAQLLNERLARTGVGQLLDIISASRDDLSRRDVIKIAAYKTAYYSFLLPLQVGAALAGASRKQLQPFARYSRYAGLAFQLQDDILGLFGDETVTGKPRMSDIMEGKRTYTMLCALESATVAERHFLLAALGDATLNSDRFARCLSIIQSTGALRKTQNLAEKYAGIALASLDHAPAQWPPHSVQFLRDIALYSARREL